MGNYDWSCFVTRINIKAPIEKLYWCWATREGMEYWFLRLSEFKTSAGSLRAGTEFVQPGDVYRWQWFGWPDDVTEEGTILDANGKDFLKFSFGKAGNCSVTIKEELGENIVELLQDSIPTDEFGMHNWHLGCKTGWTFYLANLKSMLEGGIDLRNKNESLQRVINS
ncbi:MAG: SRPBCC domain-containing protein [Ferruginibacter sp.]|nr:SRPBCC domain-containing protein [Chitinophagaceae bacterium]